MPSRWWIGLHGVDPERVSLPQLHAAFSRWFDDSIAEHRAIVKPYSLSPPCVDERGVGIEAGLLTERAVAQLRRGAHRRERLRLGPCRVEISSLEQLERATWRELARYSGARSWEVHFLTPTSFRQGRRRSPWPAPPTLLHSVRTSWDAFSPVELDVLAMSDTRHLWVSDLGGRSERVRLGREDVVGFVGRLRIEADCRRVASIADALLRLAPYSGVGSGKTKGLGVVSTTTRAVRPSSVRRGSSRDVVSVGATPPSST